MDEEIRFDDAGMAEDVPRCGEKLFIAKGRERGIGVDHERTRTSCFFRLLRARHARFRRNRRLVREVRRRVALNAWVAATTTFRRALQEDRFDMRKTCQHESY